MWKSILSALAAMALASHAHAATVNELDFGPGGFNVASGQPVSYTDIVRNIDVINGSVSANQFDMLQFTSLDAGAQTISLTFSILDPNPPSFTNAGGQLHFNDTPFNFAFDGSFVGTYQVSAGPFENPANATASLSFNLDNSFAGGPLFLHILPTFGGQVNYSLSLTGNGGGPIAPVPLPTTGLLLLAALLLMQVRLRPLRNLSTAA